MSNERSSSRSRRPAGNSESRSSGRSSGRSSSRNTGGSRSGGYSKNDGASNFVKLGSITVAGSTQKEYGDEIVEELKDSNYKLWGKVYFRNENDEVALRHGDEILISLAPNEKAPHFVVGGFSLKTED